MTNFVERLAEKWCDGHATCPAFAAAIHEALTEAARVVRLGQHASTGLNGTSCACERCHILEEAAYQIERLRDE